MTNIRYSLYNVYFNGKKIVNNSSLPKRHFIKGERKLVGFRLPEELKRKIEMLASELGWTVTDVAQTALDFYVHEELSKSKATKPKDRG
jgi:hypothetical protein